MKYRFCLYFLLLIVIFCVPKDTYSINKNKDNQKSYVNNEIIIKFRADKIKLDHQDSSLISRYAKLLLNYSRLKIFSINTNLLLKENLGFANTSVFQIKDAKEVFQKISEIKNDPNIEMVQPNFIYQPRSLGTNDTYKDNLWGLDNTGQSINNTTGTAGADIGASMAWTMSEGSSNSIVAIIDTGVAYTHPDLLDNMWNGSGCKNENGATLNNCIYGYDYEHDDKNPFPTDSDHGTHIAGTIAAIKNNNKGIIGVAPQSKVMAIKTGLTTAQNIKSISFAKQNGSKIINASWGMGITTTNCNLVFDQLLYEAIRDFPGIFVVAAGNEAQNHDGQNYFDKPSDYGKTTSCWTGLNNIISVAATNNLDELTDFSDYGVNFVDVGAPGSEIYSSTVTTGYDSYFEDFYTSTLPELPTGWVSSNNNFWGTKEINYSKALTTNVSASFYGNNINETVTSAAYDLSPAGPAGASIEFRVGCHTQMTPNSWSDYIALELSPDNTTYTELDRWDQAHIDPDPSNDYAAKTVTFNIPTNYITSNFHFRFHFVSNSTDNNYLGCFIDNISLYAYEGDPNSEDYTYHNGTSMAAPHVAGIAALLWGYNQNLSVENVKNLIVHTGDTVPSLTGKTVSGRRVNAYKALLNATGPTISGLSNDTNPVKVKTWTWTSTNSDDQCRYLINQSATTNFTSQDFTGTKTAAQSTGDGTYYLHVQCRNGQGIIGSTVSVSAILDNTPPSSQNQIFTTSIIKKSGRLVTLAASAQSSDSLWFAPAATTTFVVGDNMTTVIGTDTSIPSPITEGDYKMFVIDQAGNSSGASTATLTVNNSFAAPIITPGTGVYNSAQTITLTADENAVHTYFTLDGTNPSNVGSTEYTSPVTINGEDGSNITLKAISYDIGSSTSQTSTATYSFDKSKPSVALSIGQTGTITSLPITINMLLSETINGFTLEDIGTSNATATSLVSIGTTTFTFNLEPSINQGVIKVSIAADKFSDAAGNTNSASNEITTTYHNQDPININPINLNNGYTGTFTLPNGQSPESTTTINTSTQVIINIGGSGTITLPINTTISSTSIGATFNAHGLSVSSLSPGSITNTGQDNNVISALQWGIPNFGLQFSQATSISYYIGPGFNGQNLNLLRSLTGSSNWTTDGLVTSVCTVTNGYCSFQVTKASYFAILNSNNGGNDNNNRSNNDQTLSHWEISTKPRACGVWPPITYPRISHIKRAKNSVTLTIVPWHYDSAEKFVIVYGLKEGDERWSTEFNWNLVGDKPFEYTINGLNRRSTYFFKIRSGHGCATGPWSPWFSTKSGLSVFKK